MEALRSYHLHDICALDMITALIGACPDAETKQRIVPSVSPRRHQAKTNKPKQ